MNNVIWWGHVIEACAGVNFRYEKIVRMFADNSPAISGWRFRKYHSDSGCPWDTYYYTLYYTADMIGYFRLVFVIFAELLRPVSLNLFALEIDDNSLKNCWRRNVFSLWMSMKKEKIVSVMIEVTSWRGFNWMCTCLSKCRNIGSEIDVIRCFNWVFANVMMWKFLLLLFLVFIASDSFFSFAYNNRDDFNEVLNEWTELVADGESKRNQP